MEDIRVLENFCEVFRYAQKSMDKYDRDNYGEIIGQEEIQAIENLIARNKELEEENQKLESSNDYLSNLNHKYYEDNVTLLRKNGKVDILADDIHFKYIDDVNNYILKSKVIEYLNKMEKRCNKPKFSVMKKEIEQLLQEGDK